MIRLTRLLPLPAFVLLSACFLSEQPILAEATLLTDGPAQFCSPKKDDCDTGTVEGDGYLLKAKAEDEEDLRLRFEPLLETGDQQIYLAEAELREDGETAWAYLLARAAGESSDGTPQFVVMMPDCNDTPSDALPEGIARSDSYTCMVSDGAAFRAYLIATYGDKVGDDAWWAEQD